MFDRQRHRRAKHFQQAQMLIGKMAGRFMPKRDHAEHARAEQQRRNDRRAQIAQAGARQPARILLGIGISTATRSRAAQPASP